MSGVETYYCNNHQTSSMVAWWIYTRQMVFSNNNVASVQIDLVRRSDRRRRRRAVTVANSLRFSVHFQRRIRLRRSWIICSCRSFGLVRRCRRPVSSNRSWNHVRPRPEHEAPAAGSRVEEPVLRRRTNCLRARQVSKLWRLESVVPRVVRSALARRKRLIDSRNIFRTAPVLLWHNYFTSCSGRVCCETSRALFGPRLLSPLCPTHVTIITYS